MPASARWQALQEVSILNTGAELPWGGKFSGVAKLIDDAFDAIEKDNEKLKGVLQRISGYAVNEDTLRGLIILFSDTHFTRPTYNGEPVHLGAKDILGHVYEYFLGRFAQAEGKRGGQYFTPKSIVSLIVEMLEPYSGRGMTQPWAAAAFSCKPNALSPPIKATSTTFPSTGKNSTQPLGNLPP